MSKNGRWISKELIHLSEYMELALIDIRAGNLKSADTNLGFAMGIVKGMAKRDKKSTRSLEKIGKTISSLHKYLRPLLIEAGAIAIESYERKVKKERRK